MTYKQYPKAASQNLLIPKRLLVAVGESNLPKFCPSKLVSKLNATLAVNIDDQHFRIIKAMRNFIILACNTSEEGQKEFDRLVFVSKALSPTMKRNTFQIAFLGMCALCGQDFCVQKGINEAIKQLLELGALPDGSVKEVARKPAPVGSKAKKKKKKTKTPFDSFQPIDRYLGLMRSFKLGTKLLARFVGEGEQFHKCLAITLVFYGHPVFRKTLGILYSRFGGRKIVLRVPSKDWDSGSFGVEFLKKDTECYSGGMVSLFTPPPPLRALKSPHLSQEPINTFAKATKNRKMTSKYELEKEADEVVVKSEHYFDEDSSRGTDN